MALLPILINELLDARPSREPLADLFDQNFGLGLLESDLIGPSPRQRRRHHRLAAEPYLAGYIRPHRLNPHHLSGVSNIKHGKDGFKVNLDVQQFKPEEINVKVVDNAIVVEGKHEEREDDHGFISRSFTRRYKLPKDVDVDAVSSSLSSDGVLQIMAPNKVSINTCYYPSTKLS